MRKSSDSTNILVCAFVLNQIAAIFNHAYLSYVHYAVHSGAMGESLCNISETFNCENVAMSSYSAIFGVPLAILGLYANLILLVIGLAILLSQSDERAKKYMSLALSGGVAVVVTSCVMFLVSFFALGTFCLNCIFAYLLSFGTFVFLWIWRKKAALEGPSVWTLCPFLFSRREASWLAAVLIAFPLLASATHLWLGNKSILPGANGEEIAGLSYEGPPQVEAPDMAVSEVVNFWRESPQYDFDLTGAVSYGPEDAKMTIVEFADFACGACRMVAPLLHRFAHSRRGVRLVLLSFPLDGVCNEAMTRQGPGRSCQLAYANYCTAVLGGGWQMHHWLFDNFAGVRVGDLPAKVADFGLETEAYTSCVESEETKTAIMTQAKQGADAEITGTPAIFVNGRRMEYLPAHTIQILQAIYDSL